MIDLDDPAELGRAPSTRPRTCSRSRVELGGSVSGEHGIGLVKNGQIAASVGAGGGRDARGRSSARSIPKGLLNPGKKLARRDPPPGR